MARPRSVSARLLAVSILATWCSISAKGAERSVRFVNLTKEHGLSDNSVEAILEDHRGFMWFGTPDGLNRYDAHSFKVYRHDPRDPASLSDSYVVALLEDHEEVLWVGTMSGLNRYDRDTDSFTRFVDIAPRPTESSSDAVLEIYEDRSGKLWAATSWGFAVFDRVTGYFAHFAPEEYSRDGVSCPGDARAIHEDRRGDLWFGFDHCGLVRFDPQAERFDHFLHDPEDPASLAHDDVWDLL